MPRAISADVYDIDYAHNMTPMFYRPRLENGIIDVAAGGEDAMSSYLNELCRFMDA